MKSLCFLQLELQLHVLPNAHMHASKCLQFKRFRLQHNLGAHAIWHEAKENIEALPSAF